jgi:uncharacterized protein YjiS (DUF1127 family)
MATKILPSSTHFSGPETQSGSGALDLLATVASAPITLAKWIKREKDILDTIHELEALDDHMLKDIGIERRQIRQIVRYGRWS